MRNFSENKHTSTNGLWDEIETKARTIASLFPYFLILGWKNNNQNKMNFYCKNNSPASFKGQVN